MNKLFQLKIKKVIQYTKFINIGIKKSHLFMQMTYMFIIKIVF